MTIKYGSHITSREYAEELSFHHAEFYTIAHPVPVGPMQRGKESGANIYLLDDGGGVHPDAVLTHRLARGAHELDSLFEILRIATINQPDWMCAPVYRDAILFRDDQDNIVSSLNICLSCEYMETKRGHFVDGDVLVYTKLRELLAGLGHKVGEF